MNEVEMEHRLTSVEKLAGSNKHRIDDLESDNKALQKLSESVAVMAEQMKTMSGKIGSMDTAISALKAKPAAMWEMLLKTLVTAIVGGLAAYGLLRLGLGT